MTTANQVISRSSSESSEARGSRFREREHAALAKAVRGESLMNYEAIFDGFVAMGISPVDIKPRQNVYTFHAWKAVGRVVRKGEHGVKVFTYVEGRRTDPVNGEQSDFRLPRQTTVFHVSQTDALAAAAAGAAA